MKIAGARWTTAATLRPRDEWRRKRREQWLTFIDSFFQSIPPNTLFQPLSSILLIHNSYFLSHMFLLPLLFLAGAFFPSPSWMEGTGRVWRCHGNSKPPVSYLFAGFQHKESRRRRRGRLAGLTATIWMRHVISL